MSAVPKYTLLDEWDALSPWWYISLLFLLVRNIFLWLWGSSNSIRDTLDTFLLRRSVLWTETFKEKVEEIAWTNYIKVYTLQSNSYSYFFDCLTYIFLSQRQRLIMNKQKHIIFPEEKEEEIHGKQNGIWRNTMHHSSEGIVKTAYPRAMSTLHISIHVQK